MADDAIKTEGNGQPEVDPIVNLKAEFARKTDNIEATLKKTNEMLAAALAPKKPAQSEGPNRSVKDLWYSDEEGAANMIKESAKREMRAEFTEYQKTQQVAAGIYSDYPETQDINNPLTKRANEIFSTLSEDDRRSPIALKYAVQEAAQELGVRPKSKRTDNSDFTIGSSSGSSTTPRAGKDDMDPLAMEFAARLGLNTSDKKVVERLKASSKRTNWTDPKYVGEK